MEETLVVLFGLIIGSFLNVVIYRLPRNEDIIFRRSYCPKCSKEIPFYLNVPILSYILLRGRCRSCSGIISVRYPLVEAFTAVSFWLVFREFGLSLHTGMAFLFLCLLISLGIIDLQHMILPDSLTLGGAVVFFVYSFFNPLGYTLHFIAAGILTSLLFYGLYLFYLKIRKIEGLGLGDVKMILMLGLFLGPWKLTLSIFLSSILGLLVGLYFIIFKKKNLKFSLPFGTFLSIGSCVSLFLGDSLIISIQSLFL